MRVPEVTRGGLGVEQGFLKRVPKVTLARASFGVVVACCCCVWSSRHCQVNMREVHGRVSVCKEVVGLDVKISF